MIKIIFLSKIFFLTYVSKYFSNFIINDVRLDSDELNSSLIRNFISLFYINNIKIKFFIKIKIHKIMTETRRFELE